MAGGASDMGRTACSPPYAIDVHTHRRLAKLDELAARRGTDRASATCLHDLPFRHDVRIRDQLHQHLDGRCVRPESGDLLGAQAPGGCADDTAALIEP